jgi:hypothetical protein
MGERGRFDSEPFDHQYRNGRLHDRRSEVGRTCETTLIGPGEQNGLPQAQVYLDP